MSRTIEDTQPERKTTMSDSEPTANDEGLSDPPCSPPTFYVDRVTLNGHEYFGFACPLCGKDNYHSPEDGHRASHCECWRGMGYFIEESKELRRA